MKAKNLCLLAVCVAAGFLSTAAAADNLPWQFDYAKALAESRESRKPVLLDFTASWCGPCRMMENTTFADPSVGKLLAGYVLVKIDIDQESALATRYKVQSIPTCIMLNQFGDLVDRHTGYVPAQKFTAWLEASAKLPAASAVETKSAAATRDIMQTVRALESDNPVTRDAALARLLAIHCARNEHVEGDEAVPTEEGGEDDADDRKLVGQALRGFVERQPALAAARLNDAQLAVRIVFANLLAAKVGAGFLFDPWAPAAERAAQAQEWTRRLAAGGVVPDA